MSCLGFSVQSGQVTSEIYASVPYAVGGIAYTPDGQLVFAAHPFYNPDIRVLKYNEETRSVSPYPNAAWNTVRTTDDYFFDSVLGIRNDDRGIIWILDMGQRVGLTPKIVGWNAAKNKLERIYYIPAPASLEVSQHNDFIIDYTHNVFIIADEGIGHGGDGSKAALVIVDMLTGKTRRVLQGHWSTRPENIAINIDEKELIPQGATKPILIGADGIVNDKNDEWLYYAPLNGSKVYRIKIDALLESNNDSEIEKHIETYANKKNNGGISIDMDNNLYLTQIETHSIGIIPSDGSAPYDYSSNSQMLWPDGASYNKDTYMYVGASQIHLGSAFNEGEDLTTRPFYIFRFKPITKGIFGR